MIKNNFFSLAIALLFVYYNSYGQFIAVPENVDHAIPTINLSGDWYFTPELKEQHLGQKEITNAWTSIKVPGEWLMQGFKVEPGTEAGYFREFNVPANWKDYSVYLRCDAVFSEAHIWVNGKEVGSHTGPMVAFEKEVTEQIEPGKVNRIVMGIVSETMADTLMSGTQYAAHQLGGILRKVYLVAVPKVHLSDLWIQTDLDENYKNATLKINGQLINKSKNASSSKISIKLTGPSGKEVILSSNETQLDVNGNGSANVNLVFPIDKPEKWDAEHPNLYTLEFNVNTKGGSEKIIKSVGFRQIKVVGNQLFVNGKRIKLKGVNRHEVHPLFGRSLTNEQWEKDAKLFKAANVNYIRTSHYPPAEEFVEWCDKLGLYVELENPIAWIGHHANHHWKTHEPHDPALYPYLENISDANISFFGNHPSIIMWSMANESAWGPNWAKLADFFAKKDPTRPATFHDQAYGGFNNYGSQKMPVANIHYPGIGGPDVAENFDRPLLFGEYAHLNTYNRTEIVTDPGVRDAWGRGFKKMWEKMYKSRGCLGGAIWSGIDDVFYLPDGRSVGYGEWGPIDGWRREKPEYFHMKKSYSPIKIHNLEIATPVYGDGIRLQVENRFDFTNLSECKIEWKLGNEKGSVNMDLEPQRFGILTIHPKTDNLDGKLLEVTFTSPQGLEAESCVIEIGNVKRDDFPFVKVDSGNLNVTSNENILMIDGTGFSWTFDLKQGKIIGGKVGGSQVLNSSAELMILSLTSGECLTEHDLNIPFHNETCQDWKVQEVNWKNQNDTIIVTVQGAYIEAAGKIIYRFMKDGTAEVEYQMTTTLEINPRQVGMVFSVPRLVENLEWYRKGLWSYYPDNHIGRTRGSAIPFDEKAFYLESFGQQPKNDWRYDANKLGTNDFRATRENIYWAALTNAQNNGITVLSDGKQAFRSFVNDNEIHFLIADYSTGGGDIFFSGHYRDERRKLEPGSKISGKAKIQLVKGKKY